MQGLADLTVIVLAAWAIAILVFFLVGLSIAIDSARILRRLNKIVELLQSGPSNQAKS